MLPRNQGCEVSDAIAVFHLLGSGNRQRLSFNSENRPFVPCGFSLLLYKIHPLFLISNTHFQPPYSG